MSLLQKCALVPINPVPGPSYYVSRITLGIQLLLRFVTGIMLKIQTHWMVYNLLGELKGKKKQKQVVIYSDQEMFFSIEVNTNHVP